jgi:hypothetical protein
LKDYLDSKCMIKMMLLNSIILILKILLRNKCGDTLKSKIHID